MPRILDSRVFGGKDVLVTYKLADARPCEAAVASQLCLAFQLDRGLVLVRKNLRIAVRYLRWNAAVSAELTPM